MSTPPEPTWRVYMPEWLAVYSSDAWGPLGIDECLAFYRRQYEGRVREEDWRTRSTGQPETSPQVLEVRLPNLKGEYKDRAEAMEHYIELPHAQLVQRGSPEERELLEYGKKMLPGTR